MITWYNKGDSTRRTIAVVLDDDFSVWVRERESPFDMWPVGKIVHTNATVEIAGTEAARQGCYVRVDH